MIKQGKQIKRVLLICTGMVISVLVLASCGQVTATVSSNAAVATNASTSPDTTAALPTVTPMPTNTAVPTVAATPALGNFPATATAIVPPPTASAAPEPSLTAQGPIQATAIAYTRPPLPTSKPLPTPTPQPTVSSVHQTTDLTANQAIALAKKLLNQDNTGLPGKVNVTSYFPDTPGSKLSNYSKCGIQPVVGGDNICMSSFLGTTQAINNNGTWDINFSLVWPGKLPPGVKMPQAVHSWRLAVSPQGQATLLAEAGAPIPVFQPA